MNLQAPIATGPKDTTELNSKNRISQFAGSRQTESVAEVTKEI
jgi:hypothetical protein